MKDAGEKLEDALKADIDSAIENLKKAMEVEDKEEIKKLTEELTQASHKLAEIMYQQASQEQAQGASDPEADTDPSQDDDVVDADFEEVKK